MLNMGRASHVFLTHKETTRSSLPEVTSLNVQERLQKPWLISSTAVIIKSRFKNKKLQGTLREKGKSGANALSKRFIASPLKQRCV